MNETPVVERKKRSYSQLTQFKQCGWAYYLTRIRKVSRTPSVWLPAGSAFHLTSEAFDRHWYDVGIGAGSASIGEGLRENDPMAQADYWQNLFAIEFEILLDVLRENDPDEKSWRPGNRGKENVDWWRKAGAAMVGRYIDFRISTEDALVLAAVESGPGVEIEITTEFDGVPVVAVADRLYQDRNGVLDVVDYKSGRRLPDNPDQLGLYSLMLEEALGLPVSWGQFYDARNGWLSPPVNLTHYTRDYWGEQFVKLDEAVNAGDFKPNLTNLCKWCEVKQHCRFVGGTEPEETE